ncbi:fumarylacetoacetate hydrolase family protein [Candidatus Laterigemmans baculatus]|uniref:fumarylacetoacetate hydrolase family protein n=1 Tax=Candidatus Laterigemmans baculatus TaxID=2770505 RepID=UPI0013D9E07D|nr:fumarylacetoacetate hydrolase family protein [Candidatus Laterigemmans baculatus]
MKLAKFRLPDGSTAVGRVADATVLPLVLSGSPYASLTELLDAEDVPQAVRDLETREPLPLESVTLLPPIDRQEVWAAGVTYKRSQTARMEESEAAASCYDRVYNADRPELFFKATPHRVRGPGQPLRIRRDATWNVPEPELALVLDRRLRIVGLTVGNDMSSRDIEGENPLYLPQAKCYDASAGLGPWILLLEGPPDRASLRIRLVIHRQGQEVFAAETSAAEMARSLEDLVGWLGRDNVFPDGAILMTGTGVVPDADFTLAAGDLVEITIDGIGTLANPIIQG